MIIRKILIIFIAIFFLPLQVIADAEQTLRTEQIDVELTHDMNGLPGTTGINVLGEESYKDIDTFPERVKYADGLYWGNLFPASTIAMGRGFDITIETFLEIPPEDIASGSSEFWVRLPIDGTTVSSFLFGIDGDATASLGNYYEYQGADTDNVIWSSRGVFIRMVYPLSTSYKYGWTPEGISSGLSTYYPNNYTIDLRLVDITPRYDQVSLLYSEEIYGNSTTYLVRDNQAFLRNINASLAWSFVFLQGMPKAGLYSFDFTPRASNVDTTYITPGEPYYTSSFVHGWRDIPKSEINGSYITLQLPFLGTSIWHVRMTLGSGVFNTAGSPTTWSGNISSKSDMLTVSSAWRVLTSDETGDMQVDVLFSPVSKVRLFSMFDEHMRNNYDSSTDYIEQTEITRFGDFVYTDGLTGWTKDFAVFYNIYVTDGVYAEYTWTGQSEYVDFGWGTGNIYPGTMEILILLDNQSSVYWSGNPEILLINQINTQADLVKNQNDTGEEGLFELVYNAVINTGRGLWDGIKGIITTLWSYIADALEIIGNFVINLVGKIIAFIKEMITFIGNILKGALYVMPIALMLTAFKFTGDPAGFKEDVEKLKTQETRKIVQRLDKSTQRTIKRTERRIKK